ncbi:sensor histidine kinase [Isoptericola variabilis]|uniref:histidine kinase n=1 Tax=Isoptericola variabilis (strain 225) TaxID=743718 RepID=F6FRC1_ISOV2|nr:ATP-binding protein [Isoptericola variabilis]AEG43882.1 putative signal transduction histidine kinase [Isoptericola variabilis 225]TWH30472.1 hypothetical protein L600_000300000250 [Isoptericola variabilis J7]
MLPDSTVRRWIVVGGAATATLAALAVTSGAVVATVVDASVGVAFALVAARAWPARRASAALALGVTATWAVGSVLPFAVFWHRGVLVHLVVHLSGTGTRGVRWGAIVTGYVVAATPYPWSRWEVSAATVLVLGALAVVPQGLVDRSGRHALAALGAGVGAALALSSMLPGVGGMLAAAVAYAAALLGAAAILARAVRSRSVVHVIDLMRRSAEEPHEDAVAAFLERHRGTVDPRVAAEAAQRLRALERANRELLAALMARVAELEASRERILHAAETEREVLAREIDGAVVDPLMALADRLEAAADGASTDVTRAVGLARRAARESAAISHGLRPQGLVGGLAAALRRLADAAPAGVVVDVDAAGVVPPLPPDVEASCYFVASEAMANAVAHGHARTVRIALGVDAGFLTLTVVDDGVGGADPGRGSGLAGLATRVAAAGGSLTVDSPPGAGTVVRARFTDVAAQAGRREAAWA